MIGTSQTLWFLILMLAPICGAEVKSFAKYYWSLRGGSSKHVISDEDNLANGEIHAAEFIKNDRLGGAVSFGGGERRWIAFLPKFFKDFLADPDFSQQGISIGFWIRYRGGRYILSTGALTNSTKGTGFQIIYDKASSRFVAFARTIQKVWKASSPAHNNTWCYVMITWSSNNGLRFYLDSKLTSRDLHGSQEIIDSSSFSHMLTIASPPDVYVREEFGIFDMAHLAIWDHELAEELVMAAPAFKKDDQKGNAMCIEKRKACIRDSCGEDCLVKYQDAVCLDFAHTTCKGFTVVQGPVDEKRPL